MIFFLLALIVLLLPLVLTVWVLAAATLGGDWVRPLLALLASLVLAEVTPRLLRSPR